MLSRIRKNDTVVVTAGKDRGKSGKVIGISAEANRATVERLNLVKRHTKGTGPQSAQGIIEKEAPIHMSNLMLFCEKCSKPVRISMKRAPLDAGASAADRREARRGAVRICRKCGDQIG